MRQQLLGLGRAQIRPRSLVKAAMLAVASVWMAGAAPAAAATWAPDGNAGEFSVVAYNVAGLPAFLSSADPARNTPEIGRRLMRFDLVNVQEDFNYHRALYSTATFPHRTSTSGGIPFGDGMNTMANFSFANLARVRWRHCSGDTCLTPKGFTYKQVRLQTGAWVDVYNLHTNAGVSRADTQARRRQLFQLTEYMRWRSAGKAVIVAGDTNARYTRQADDLGWFLWANGLRDSWVDTQRGGVVPAPGPDNVCTKGQETDGCEVVDKIFYRSGETVRLDLQGYANEDRAFLDGSGRPLSDHRPVSSRFRWSVGGSAFRLRSEQSGLCLDIAGVSEWPGANLTQWSCTGGDNQVFRQVGDTLRVGHSGQCLAVADGSRAWGARVIQSRCTGGAEQRVRWEGNRIRFGHSDLCLNVAGASRDRGAQLIQWPCSGAANERFSRG